VELFKGFAFQRTDEIADAGRAKVTARKHQRFQVPELFKIELKSGSTQVISRKVEDFYLGD